MPRFNQTGFTPLIIVLIVGLLLAAAGGGAYYFLNKQSTIQAPQATPIASASASLGQQDSTEVTKIKGCDFDDLDLCQGISNFEKIMTAKMTQKFGDITQELIINSEDKLTREKRYNSRNELISDRIITDKAEYIKDMATQKWKKVDYTDNDSTTFDIAAEQNPFVKFPKPEDVTIKKTQESCGMRKCFKFQLDSKGTEIGISLWFDDEKYLTQKMTMTQNNELFLEATYDYENTFISIPEEKDIISPR